MDQHGTPTTGTPRVNVIQSFAAYLLAGEESADAFTPTISRLDAARNLLAAVGALPEFTATGRLQADVSQDGTKELAAVDRALSELREQTATGRRFQLRAEELAARLRLLQDEHPELNPCCSTLLRRLTAMAMEAGTYVFGLARSHRANWRDRATRARAGIARASQWSVSTAAWDGRELQLMVPSESAGQHHVPLALPKLRAASARGAIVIVGGNGRSSVRERVAHRAGLDVEWIETRSAGGLRLVQSLGARLRAGSVSALVVVDGAIRHDASRMVMEAARAADVPVAYAKKGGLNRVLHAFVELERQFTEERVA